MKCLLTGNDYLVTQKVNELKATFKDKYPEGELVLISGEEKTLSVDDLLAIDQSVGLFTSVTCIIVTQFTDKKDFVEQIDQLLNELDLDTWLILVAPNLDKRLSIVKKLIADKRLQYIEQKIPDVPTWVIQQAKKSGSTLGKSEALYLIERVGDEPALLASEVKKLALYDSKITRSTIETLTTATGTSSIFELVNAICGRDKKRALKIYEEQVTQGVQPQAVIGMLAWQLHLMALASSLKTGDIKASAKKAKVSEYALQKSSQLAHFLSEQELQAMISDLTKIDFASKTKSFDANSALKNYIVTH